MPTSESLKDKRDHAILALLLGCGLRRAELTGLNVCDFQPRDGRWVILNLFGKGGHIRTVPVPEWVMTLLRDWFTSARIDGGRAFKKVSRPGSVWGKGISEKTGLVDRPYQSYVD